MKSSPLSYSGLSDNLCSSLRYILAAFSGRNELNEEKVQGKKKPLKITVHPEAERQRPTRHRETGLNIKQDPAHVPKPDGGAELQ